MTGQTMTLRKMTVTFSEYAEMKAQGRDVKIEAMVWVGERGYRMERWEPVPGREPARQAAAATDGGKDEE